MDRYTPVHHDHGYAVIDTATACRCFGTETQDRRQVCKWTTALNIAYDAWLVISGKVKRLT